MVDEKRRNTLKGVGALLTGTAIAGCTGENGDSSDQNETSSTPENGETTEYQLNLTAEDIDLRDLEFEQPYEEDEILEEHYTELEYSLTGNGEELEPDEVYLEVNGEETDYSEQIPENILPELETELTLYAEIDGETVEQTTEIQKQLPDTFIYDAENETPYQFNTINDLEELHREERENYHQHQLERAETGDLTEQTTEKDEIVFDPETMAGLEYSHGEHGWSTEHFENMNWPEDREEILNDAMVAWRQEYRSLGNSAPSTNADEMSHNQAQLIKKHHGVELEDEIVPFNASNHGHGMSYHYLPEKDEVMTSDPAGWVGPARIQASTARFSPIVDYHKGEPEEEYELGTYSRKKSLGIGAYVGAAMIEQKAGVALQDSTILEGMEAIRNDSYGQDGHYERSKKLLAADHYYGSHNNQYRILSYKDQERDHIVISTDEELHEKYGEQPEEPTWQDIEQAA